MNLTEEQLNEVEKLAGLFFSPSEIMIAIELPLHMEEDFRQVILIENDHPLFIAYNRGRLTAEIQLRQSIKQAALNGSNPAQASMLELLNHSKL